MINNKYHFIGICGISMSALAFWLKQNGNYVQGSDLQKGSVYNFLIKNGIKVYIGHNKNNLNDCNVVVYNAAIIDNAEVKEAQKRGITVISRAELLAKIAKKYKTVVAISGSHGKTSTTAMLYSVLKHAGKHPTLHLGGILKNSEIGLEMGKNDYFVSEACEYKNSFLTFNADIGVILNVEAEHLDFFKNYKNVIKSFEKFKENSKQCVVFNDGLIKKDKKCITYGTKNSDYVAKNIKALQYGKHSFDCYIKNKFYKNFFVGATGRHNVQNALAVIAICKLLDIDDNSIFFGIKNFDGVKRRYEFLLEHDKAFLVHDYAHHPTEIKKVIEATKQIVSSGKFVVVFQPHTYSRTKAFMNDFVKVFSDLKNVVIIKTYAAREQYSKEGSAYTLYKNIKLKNKFARYYANFDVANKYLKHMIDKGYGVLILGAGDIDKMAYKLAKLC